MRHVLASALAAVVLVAATLAAGAPAVADDDAVVVEVDRARVVRLDAPAGTIILGNPAIADALVQDSRMLVLTGKSYGTTNLIVLDGEGETVDELTLHVRAADDGIVTVQRGQSRSSLSCAPECAPTLRVGDTPEAYDALSSQIDNHVGRSEGQAGR